MKKSIINLIVAVLFLFFAGTWIMGGYNELIVYDQNVKNTWAEVEVQYQRRFDLIPNFTAATKGYLGHEQQVFKDIADARTKYSGASNSNEKIEATNSLEGALSRLLIVMENYPNLKADTQIVRLTDELAGTENRIAISRTRYNNIAGGFNKRVRTFPNNILAKIFDFDIKNLYTSTQNAEVAPVVNLEINNTK